MNRQGDGKRRIVIRADASARIGLGHLRRCTTLGRRLAAAGVDVHFLSNAEGLDLAAEVGGVAAACVPLESDLLGKADAVRTVEYCREVGADRLIVDHYQADEAYQRVLLDSGVRWLQFDGAASMPLWADWVVSMSPAADEVRYRALRRRAETRFLLGPRYALLRDEFLRWRAPESPRKCATQLVFTFGGGDDRGACLTCLSALPKAGALEVTILSSSYNPQIPSIRDWLERNGDARVRLLIDDSNVARHMAEADIAVTAGGATTFEMAYLGLPALIVQIADNQRPNAQAWERAGVAIDLGPLEQIDTGRLQAELIALAGDRGLRERMARLGRASVDGRGAERIVREIYPDMEAKS